MVFGIKYGSKFFKTNFFFAYEYPIFPASFVGKPVISPLHCLCTIVKNENRYLDEWIKYHRDIGFDHIVIYDNNDIDGETIDVSKYDFVEVIDYRGKYIDVPKKWNPNATKFSGGIQEQAYDDCYLNKCDGYQWVAFLDIDEFLEIDGNIKVNDFLSQKEFSDVDAIQINWEIYGDNGNVIYDSRPVLERFTTPTKIQRGYVKSIVRTNNPNFKTMKAHHVTIDGGKFVYPNGEPTHSSPVQKMNLDGARIRHYYTKTIEEWIDRRCGTTMVCGTNYMNNPKDRIKEFFWFNDITEEKMQIIKEKLGDDFNIPHSL